MNSFPLSISPASQALCPPIHNCRLKFCEAIAFSAVLQYFDFTCFFIVKLILVSDLLHFLNCHSKEYDDALPIPFEVTLYHKIQLMNYS